MLGTTNRDRFRLELVDQYTRLFKESVEYSFAATHTSPEALASKMTNGLLQGTANKDGEGIKNTCKVLGIKHTYKEIKTYLLR